MAETTRPRGVYAAIMKPLTRDFEVDLPLLVAHGRWLLANGCDGLAPLGTTGEANSLSVDQRLRVIDGMASAGLPMGRMIVGTGSCALADTVELARAALAAGCPNVLVIPPFYYKSPSDAGLHAFYAAMIDRVKDRRLRVYLYHFPQMSTVPITPALIEMLRASHGPEVIAGLKDSSGDWNNTKALIERFPGFDVFSGSEHFLAQNLAAGGPGCISATTNVTAPVARAVMAAGAGPQAEKLQEGLSELRLTIQAFPLIAALKHIKAELSGEPAWARLLPPLVPLDAGQAATLMTRLRAARDFARLQETMRLAA
ncbi:MAG: dihydrodipicolinate synthase family protein [Alphaproteobacteria bacterium]|nr:dihydrodipicolinate synthase family protein [Alphaproteobacteria bacterium]